MAVLLVVVLPPRFTADRNFTNAVDELKAQNDIRTSLLQTLVGTVLATGVYLTWRELQMNREGQASARFDKAIDRLHELTLVARLGGLRTLERIATNSREDRDTIAKILCEYIHNPNSPAKVMNDSNRTTNPAANDVPESTGNTETYSIAKCPDDVEEATKILGRWQDRLGEKPAHLELDGAILQRARLGGLKLPGADLSGAHLEQADLSNTHLQDAKLRNAVLVVANFGKAQLQRADLSGAKAQRADFRDAQLQNANLSGAKLQYAKLGNAQLQNAILRSAQLQFAVLNGARLNYAKLAAADMSQASLSPSELEGADLRSTQLRNAALVSCA